MRSLQYLFTLLILLSAVQFSKAQISGVLSNVVYYTGIVVDSVTNEPIVGAVVTEVTGKDKQVEVKNYVTDQKGRFNFMTYISRQKRIEVSCLGYKLFSKDISLDVEHLPVNDNRIDLDKIKLSPDLFALDEVIVKARIKMYEIKGDTMVIFPRAIKTMEGDNILEILRQVPGVEILKDGYVMVWGQKIEQSKVNGVLLFGDDPRTALHTIDAKDASLVMIYDEVDERDEILYGKNARKRKVANILTFEQFKNVVSGDIRIEGGADRNKGINADRQERYLGSIKGGHYNEKNQIELGGNIDNRNLIGNLGGSKPSGYNRKWNINSKVSGKPDSLNSYTVSYNYDNKYTTSFSISNSSYFPTSDYSSQTSENISSGLSESGSHRIGLKYDFLNKRHDLNIRFDATPTFERSKHFSESLLEMFRDNTLLTKTEQNRSYRTDYFSASSQLNIDKRFRRNSITFLLYSAYSASNDTEIQNDTIYSTGLAERTVLNIDSDKSDVILFPSLNYNINFDRIGRLMLKSSVAYQKSVFCKHASDRYTGVPDNALSGDETSSSAIIRGGAEYIFTKDNHTISTLLSYQGMFIYHDERIPVIDSRQKRFFAFTPVITYTIGQYTPKQWKLHFSVEEGAIRSGDLTTRLDATNPMYLRTGNPDLKPSETYFLHLSRFIQNDKKSFNFNLFIYLYHDGTIIDRIYYTNSTILPNYNNYEVPAGATLVLPVNEDYSIRIKPNIEYKTQISPIKSTLNVKAEYCYSNPQEGVNDTLVRTYEHTGNIVTSLISNFSQVFRTELKNNTQYRRFENSAGNIDNYLSEIVGVNFRWDFMVRAYLTGNYTFEYYHTTYSTSVRNHILNASIGCRIFKNRKGAISFNAYDILDRTANFTTTVNNQAVSNLYKQMYSSFFTIGFEYKFNNTK